MRNPPGQLAEGFQFLGMSKLILQASAFLFPRSLLYIPHKNVDCPGSQQEKNCDTGYQHQNASIGSGVNPTPSITESSPGACFLKGIVQFYG